MNKHKLNKAALFSMLLIPLLLLLPSAYASPQMSGSGTFTATVTSETVVHLPSGNTVYTLSGPDVFTGIISGTATFAITLLVHPSGADSGRGTVTCPCSVNGQTGTINIRFTSKGTFGGSGSGHFTDTGSGGLADFHAVGNFQFVTTSTGFSGPYQLEYHFDG
ncbi:MAG: hypothetical protein OK455_10295 [Thaumarchaeota archaeon]|nr:hypothetical protein [Nitrososphaerota archaeon]